MKIKKIIYLYIFTLSLTLLGSEILEDEEVKKAIEKSLKEQNPDPTVTKQNLEYKLSELENELKELRKTLEGKAYIMFFDLNTKIKSTKEEEEDINKYNNIREQIKDIMNIIPHEVLEIDNINKLTWFTTMWTSIQRGESKIIDPLESIAEKIEQENILQKVKKAQADIDIYNEALKRVEIYIEKNNIKENKIINKKEEQKRQKEEQIKKRNEEYERLRKKESEERNKKREEAEALEKVAEFEKEEEERKKIKRENDPTLKEIKKIKDIMYEKVSDYFNTKNFETKLKEAKEKENEEAINDIQKKIELIMKYCPHEFFTEENIQNTFPEIIKAWQNTQREHRNESKIVNPTEKNEENLENWKNELKQLNIHTKFNTDKINEINEKLLKNLKTESFNKLRKKSILEKRNHIQSGLVIGLLAGLGGVLLHNNFFKQSSRKKMDLLQKALILSGSTILGGIGGKYFYQMKKHIPQKLRKDKPNKIHKQ